MSHEEDPLGVHLLRIKCGQPSLAQTGRQNHQTPAPALAACVGQRSQSGLLNRMRLCRRLILFRGHACAGACAFQAGRGWLATADIVLDPGVAQHRIVGMRKQLIEALANFQESAVARMNHAVVPFQAVGQGLPADVARSDKSGSLDQAAIHKPGEDISLEVKAAIPGFMDAHLGALLLQQHQQLQRLRIGDAQIVAGQNAQSSPGMSGHSFQVGQQQSQTAGLHEGHRQIDFAGQGTGRGKLTQQGIVISAGDQALGSASYQRIDPALAPLRAHILGLPAFDVLHRGQRGQPAAQRGLVGIGEAAPLMLAHSAPELEAQVHHATRTQGAPQAAQHIRHVSFRDMQEARTAPDAIEAIDVVNLLETPNGDWKVAVPRCQFSQCGRGVKGADAEALCRKSAGVAA